MPITYIINQNILDSACQSIVNTVNCEGIMGKGLAREVKERYPGVMVRYSEWCKRDQFKPGMISFYRIPGTNPPGYIINAATKGEWRAPSQYGWIERILVRLKERIQSGDITSLAIPKLGCGNGGLKWDIVCRLIVFHLEKCAIPIEIYINEGDVQYEWAS